MRGLELRVLEMLANFWCTGKTMPETFIYDLKVLYGVYQALRHGRADGRMTNLNRVIK